MAAPAATRAKRAVHALKALPCSEAKPAPASRQSAGQATIMRCGSAELLPEIIGTNPKSTHTSSQRFTRQASQSPAASPGQAKTGKAGQEATPVYGSAGAPSQ